MNRTARLQALMPHAARAVTDPGGGVASANARIVRVTPEDLGTDHPSAIAPWMAEAFHALTHASETGERFALVSCTLHDEPAVVIAFARKQGQRTHLTPLFVAVQPEMRFAAHPEDSEEGA